MSKVGDVFRSISNKIHRLKETKTVVAGEKTAEEQGEQFIKTDEPNKDVDTSSFLKGKEKLSKLAYHGRHIAAFVLGNLAAFGSVFYLAALNSKPSLGQMLGFVGLALGGAAAVVYGASDKEC